MARFRTIQYGIDMDTALVISRIGGQMAVPVLDFAGMTPENSYKTNYNLKKFNIYECHTGPIRWTRKIPTAIKNVHRVFWGMKELKRN